tara:strand:- start:306 stop:713 length:408 start_codon:yes stop_codon:yes gene_type:complete
VSCNLKPVIESNGIQNLDNRTALIIPGETNKNDIVKLLGETLLKEEPNENKWAYIETIEKKTLGKKKIIKNTMLILEFDNKGVLKTKTILNKNDFNKIKFDKTETNSSALNSSFSKRIFSSIRKRAQNKINKISK